MDRKILQLSLFYNQTALETYNNIIEEYEITYKDILAVLDYAAKVLSNEEVRTVG